MKRVVCALLVSSGLLFAGCSATAEPESDTTTTSSKTTEVEQEFAQVGDSISVDCQGARCAGELRIEEILLGTGCKATLVAEDIPDGMQLVQVSGILTAVEKVTDGGGAEIGVTPEIPVAWDSENFKTTAEWGGGCDIPQDYEQWNTVPAKMGEKVRVYGSYLVTDDAKTLGIANSKFDLGELPAAPTTSSSPETSSAARSSAAAQRSATQQVPAQQPSSVALAPARQEDEAVVGYTEAPGHEEPQMMEKQIASCGDPSIHETGTTFFTDGTSGWTVNCAEQMM